MAKASKGKFSRGAAATKSGGKGQKDTKSPFPGARSKAQGGTKHKMSKPEGSKGGLRGGMSKGKNLAAKSGGSPTDGRRKK